MAAVAEASIGAAIGSEIRQAVLKNVKPVFNSIGKLAEEILTKIPKMITDKLKHHHHVYVKEYSGVDIIIDELATDTIGHRLRLTVLWSPEDKMNDKTFESSGRSAEKARDDVLKCIEALAKYYYKKA